MRGPTPLLVDFNRQETLLKDETLSSHIDYDHKTSGEDGACSGPGSESWSANVLRGRARHDSCAQQPHEIIIHMPRPDTSTSLLDCLDEKNTKFLEGLEVHGIRDRYSDLLEVVFGLECTPGLRRLVLDGRKFFKLWNQRTLIQKHIISITLCSGFPANGVSPDFNPIENAW